MINIIEENGQPRVVITCDRVLYPPSSSPVHCGRRLEVKESWSFHDEECRMICPECEDAIAKENEEQEEYWRQHPTQTDSILTSEEEAEIAGQLDYEDRKHRMKAIDSQRCQVKLAYAAMLAAEASREKEEVARGERQIDEEYLLKQAFAIILADEIENGVYHSVWPRGQGGRAAFAASLAGCDLIVRGDPFGL